MEVARIHTDGGTLLLPARTPYEREVVLDHVRHRLRLHGSVHLEMNGWRGRIERVGLPITARCGACAAPIGGFACRIGSQMLCLGCALPERSRRRLERLDRFEVSGR